MKNSFPADHSVPTITVDVTDLTRAQLVEQAAGDDAFKRTLADTPVLFVPFAGHVDYEGPVFPQGTLEVLQHFREALPAGVAVDITVDDDRYRELTLHAAEIILPTLFVSALLGPVAINLLSSYLYDVLKDARARHATRVRAKMFVETEERTVQIEYDGPVDQFAEVTRVALERGGDHADRDREPRRLVGDTDSQRPKRLKDSVNDPALGDGASSRRELNLGDAADSRDE
jgi:hypothetical protein